MIAEKKAGAAGVAAGEERNTEEEIADERGQAAPRDEMIAEEKAGAAGVAAGEERNTEKEIADERGQAAPRDEIIVEEKAGAVGVAAGEKRNEDESYDDEESTVYKLMREYDSQDDDDYFPSDSSEDSMEYESDSKNETTEDKLNKHYPEENDEDYVPSEEVQKIKGIEKEKNPNIKEDKKNSAHFMKIAGRWADDAAKSPVKANKEEPDKTTSNATKFAPNDSKKSDLVANLEQKQNKLIEETEQKENNKMKMIGLNDQATLLEYNILKASDLNLNRVMEKESFQQDGEILREEESEEIKHCAEELDAMAARNDDFLEDMKDNVAIEGVCIANYLYEEIVDTARDQVTAKGVLDQVAAPHEERNEADEEKSKHEVFMEEKMKIKKPNEASKNTGNETKGIKEKPSNEGVKDIQTKFRDKFQDKIRKQENDLIQMERKLSNASEMLCNKVEECEANEKEASALKRNVRLLGKELYQVQDVEDENDEESDEEKMEEVNLESGDDDDEIEKVEKVGKKTATRRKGESEKKESSKEKKVFESEDGEDESKTENGKNVDASKDEKEKEDIPEATKATMQEVDDATKKIDDSMLGHLAAQLELVCSFEDKEGSMEVVCEGCGVEITTTNEAGDHIETAHSTDCDNTVKLHNETKLNRQFDPGINGDWSCSRLNLNSAVGSVGLVSNCVEAAGEACTVVEPRGGKSDEVKQRNQTVI